VGAQMALLLAGTDGRVSAVAAMVPPALSNTVAVVAPLNVVPQLAATRVWLLTADDDEHASVHDNAALFGALPGAGKQHLRFAGGHVLPADYVERLRPWLTEAGRSANATPSAALHATHFMPSLAVVRSGAAEVAGRHLVHDSRALPTRDPTQRFQPGRRS
jgi:hypothetical protein